MEAPHWSLGRDRIREVVNVPRLGVLADFDGTLSHFTLDPMVSKPEPANVAALDALADAGVILALVSGRPVASLHDRLPRSYLTYHGSHGLDYWDGSAARLNVEAQPWEAPFQALLAEFGTPPESGVVIENKRATGSVHYRQAPDPAAARESLYQRLKPLADKHGFMLSEGRWIWEIHPPITLNKGTSVRALIAQFALDGAIFLGDDITDLSAIDAIHELAATTGLRGLAVGVRQPDGGPVEVRERVDLLVESPDEVAALLRYIYDLRKIA